jgi:hypothetical protein
LLLLFPAFVAAPPLSLTHFASDGYCARRAKYVVNPTRLIIAFLECCLHWILIFAAASARARRRYLHLRDRRQPECTLQIMKRRALHWQTIIFTAARSICMDCPQFALMREKQFTVTLNDSRPVCFGQI